jgi:hypothetical protein
MMTKLKSETLNIGKLFSQEYFFRVPEYQRPFSWDIENLQDLVDDLISASKDSDYFLGTLVMHSTGGDNYDVIDGQQRLTALFILLACIRDTTAIGQHERLSREIQEKISQPEKIFEGVEARNRIEVRDQSIFNGMVATVGGTQSFIVAGRPNPVEARYLNARDIFVSRIETLAPDDLIALVKFIFTRCVVIFLAAVDFQEAFKLFTVVNDRGKQLRRIDILKAHNIEPSLIADDQTRRRYAHDWEAMETALGERNFEDLFHILRLIYTKDKPQKDLLYEFENRIFSKPRMPQPGKGFIDELADYVRLYEELFIDRDYLESEDCDNKFRVMTWAMVSHFPASEWKACLLAYAKRFGKSGIYDYLLALEKVYLTHWVAAMRKDERYDVYTDLLKSIATGADSSDVLAEAESRANVGEIQSACFASNFYTVGYSKYMLIRAEISTGDNEDIREYKVRSVEHVLPQRPAEASEWRSWFTAAEVDEVVNMAGNLVLISKSKNSSASNKELNDKKKTYLTPRVSDFPRSIQVLQYDIWDKSVIETRTREFAELVVRAP